MEHRAGRPVTLGHVTDSFMKPLTFHAEQIVGGMRHPRLKGGDEMNLEQYGPWAIAFGLVLMAFRDVFLQLLRRDSSPPPPRDGPTSNTMTDLARAVDKLSGVLDRMEKAHDKALNDIYTILRDMQLTLTEMRAQDREAMRR